MESKSYTLEKSSELRVEIDTSATTNLALVSSTPSSTPSTTSTTTNTFNKCKLVLVKGTAEIFGTELIVQKEYFISESNIAIFTWHGCEITLAGNIKSAYISNETPMSSIIAFHGTLNDLRKNAVDKQMNGPRVLILGPPDTGKFTVARILLSYAVRSGYHPLYIDLDVSHNNLSIPGTVAATSIDQPISCESSTGISVKAPLVFYYGHTSQTVAGELYNKMLDRLAVSIQRRVEKNTDSRNAGAVITMAPWIEGTATTTIYKVASTFKVDIVLVIGAERLYADLKSDNKFACTISKVNKSGGAVSRDKSLRAQLRTRSIREYFYGSTAELYPHQRVVAFKDIQIYQLGVSTPAPESALTIGAKRLLDPNALNKVYPSLDLLHVILGVSYATDEKQLLDTNISGFVYVSSLDMNKKTMTLLAPAPGPLPSIFLLMGSIKWID
jgi:polyribonucleotide 5'-hydroxyl-kinase